jgi:hypothetical protein
MITSIAPFSTDASRAFFVVLYDRLEGLTIFPLRMLRGEPFLVTFATNCRMDLFAAPTFHEGNGSVASMIFDNTAHVKAASTQLMKQLCTAFMVRSSLLT